jgi:phage terminase large subunit-like protein
MTDQNEELGPDANEVRRHAKKMHTEAEYRRKYRRIDFYKPNKKQLEFHNIDVRELMLRAGNQLGKTTAGAAQLTFDALGDYPDWYQGRRFSTPPKIERPFDFLAWAASTTSTTTRDGVQTKLLGDVRQRDGLGTGLIPLDNITGRPTMARGISDFVDTITLRREVGGTALIRFKTFEMDRKAFQGEAVDVVWIDEDPADDDVYGECLARLTATDGRIIFTSTPRPGRTPVPKRFIARIPGTAEVQMKLVDAEHIPVERHPAIRAQFKDSERLTRTDGEYMQGEGTVFEIAEHEIKFVQDPKLFPSYWPWMWGVDFQHAGMSASGHPFAAVLCCWSRDDGDCIYIVHALKLHRMLPPQHVEIMKKHPCWDAPVAWPHDGNNRGFESGEKFADTYRRLGLNMLSGHARFAATGDYNFENGIAEMEARFATGRLKVAEHLSEWWEEYRGYHRENGLVVKTDDDLMSATRMLVMDIRRARELGPRYGIDYWRDPQPQQQRRYAKGTEVNQPFDLFTGRPMQGTRGGRVDWDIFSGGR